MTKGFCQVCTILHPLQHAISLHQKRSLEILLRLILPFKPQASWTVWACFSIYAFFCLFCLSMQALKALTCSWHFLQSLCSSMQSYKRHTKVQLKGLKFTILKICSNAPIGHPLGLVIDRLNTSASLYKWRFFPSLNHFNDLLLHSYRLLLRYLTQWPIWV